MGRADAVGTGVATADDQHILVLSVDKLVFLDLLAGQHTVLLGQHLEGEIHTLEVASWDLEVACLRCSGAHHNGVERSGELVECHHFVGAQRGVVLNVAHSLLVAHHMHAKHKLDALLAQ